MSIKPTKKIVTNIIDYLSFAGSIISVIGIVVSLAVIWKASYEWLIVLGSILISFIVGLYSEALSKSLRQLTRSRRVFLSYSYVSENEVKGIAEILRQEGAKVWLDKERIHAGDSLQEVISKAIDDTDSFVMFLSKEPSPNLMLELSMAQAKGKKIIPVLLEDAQLPANLQGLKYIDLREKDKEAVQELVRATT